MRGIKDKPLLSFAITAIIVLYSFRIIPMEYIPLDGWKTLLTNKYWWFPVFNIIFRIAGEILPDVDCFALGFGRPDTAEVPPYLMELKDAWCIFHYFCIGVMFSLNYGWPMLRFIIPFTIFRSILTCIMCEFTQRYYPNDPAGFKQVRSYFYEAWYCRFLVAVHAWYVYDMYAFAMYMDGELTPGVEFLYGIGWSSSCFSGFSIPTFSAITGFFSWLVPYYMIPYLLIGDCYFYVLHRLRHRGTVSYSTHLAHHRDETRVPDGFHYILSFMDISEVTYMMFILHNFLPGYRIQTAPFQHIMEYGMYFFSWLNHSQHFNSFGFILDEMFMVNQWYHQLHHLCGNSLDCNHGAMTTYMDFLWGTWLKWEDVPKEYKLTAAAIVDHYHENPASLNIPGIDELVEEARALLNTTVGAGNKAVSGFETFTRNKVAELRSKGHVLIIIKGGVYDVTHFSSHPGGLIVMQNSMELADAFADVDENHTQGAKNSMSNYLIGCMDDQDFVSLTKEGAEDDHNFVGYIDLQPAIYFMACSMLLIASWCALRAYTEYNAAYQNLNGRTIELLTSLQDRFTQFLCFCCFLAGMIVRSPVTTYNLYELVIKMVGRTFHLDAEHIRQLKVIKREIISESVLSLTVKLPGACALNIKPGQHLTITSICAVSGSIITRSYTPIDIYENGHFKLLIKLYKNGKMGNILSSLVADKDSIGVQLSRSKIAYHGEGKFLVPQKGEYKEEHYDEMLFFAGGSGATSAIQMLEGIARDTKQTMSLTCIFCASTPEQLILPEEMQKFNQHEHINVEFVASRVPENSDFKGHHGRVGHELFDKFVDMCVDHVHLDKKICVAFCGPPGFEKNIHKLVKEHKDLTEINVYRWQ